MPQPTSEKPRRIGQSHHAEHQWIWSQAHPSSSPLRFGREAVEDQEGSHRSFGSYGLLCSRQLSASLPTVIPRLSDVLTDSHTQVDSCQQESQAIRRSHFESRDQGPHSTLLQALIDPNTKTAGALPSYSRPVSFITSIHHLWLSSFQSSTEV
ncbi:hypothetical protein L7F22_044447 [Adiantum nelumboides]|nr:hypothetical protein [Adiantum nelumboides]